MKGNKDNSSLIFLRINYIKVGYILNSIYDYDILDNLLYTILLSCSSVSLDSGNNAFWHIYFLKSINTFGLSLEYFSMYNLWGEPLISAL